MAIGVGILQNQAAGLAHQGQKRVARLGNYQNVAVLEGAQGLFVIAAHTEAAAAGLLRHAPAGDQDVAHHMHLHQIGGAADAQRYAGGHHHQLAVVQEARILAGLYGTLEQVVGVGGLLDHEGDHAPAQIELAAHGFIGGAADDGAAGAVLGNHACGAPSLGHGKDGRRAQVMRRRTGGMGDRVGHIGRKIGVALLEALAVVDIRFGAHGDARHGLHGLHRILARRCLPRYS